MTHRILLTGAAGAAATGIRPLLRERGHELVLLDLSPAPEPDAALERVVTGSFLDDAVLDDALAGVDLVVHLGGYSRERPWADIVETNITGTQRVLEACRRHGVHHVLLASSLHAQGFWPVGTDPDAMTTARPDTYYGVGKVAMEALGALYADRFGMRVVSARIGTIEAEPSGRRSLSTWISPRDFVRLIESTGAEAAAGHHAVWAVSANRRRWFPLREEAGWLPLDDAEVYAAGISEPEQPGPGVLGGAFADDEHPVGGIW